MNHNTDPMGSCNSCAASPLNHGRSSAQIIDIRDAIDLCPRLSGWLLHRNNSECIPDFDALGSVLDRLAEVDPHGPIPVALLTKATAEIGAHEAFIAERTAMMEEAHTVLGMFLDAYDPASAGGSWDDFRPPRHRRASPPAAPVTEAPPVPTTEAGPWGLEPKHVLPAAIVRSALMGLPDEVFRAVGETLLRFEEHLRPEEASAIRELVEAPDNSTPTAE